MGSADQTLDPGRFEMLRELDDGDGEFIGTIVREFEADARRQVAAMAQALAADDAPAFERAAHALKGAAANLGAESLAEMCERLQTLGRGGTIDAGAGLLGEVDTELGRVLDALRQVMAGV